MTYFRTLATLTATCALLATSPAQAQSKKELAAADMEMMARIVKMENRILTGDPAAERLMQRMDALEASIRTLTGEVEQLRFERDNLRTEVEALSNDLTKIESLAGDMRRHLDAVDRVAQDRMQATTPRVYGGGQPVSAPVTGSAPVTSPTPMTGTAPTPPVSAGGGNIGVNTSYDAAELGRIGQQKLAEGDFIGAQTAFKQYLQLNPDAAEAGETYFWLGETYFVRGGYADAADAYIASMRANKDGGKAPEAMIRLGAALRELGQKETACDTLASFTVQYPSASAPLIDRARAEANRTGCS